VRVLRAGSKMVRFEVSDSGVGIDAATAESLFEPFVQADQSTTRLFGGTGIGLTIARELTEQMGGTIGAESRDAGGSTFWFTAELPTMVTPEAPLLTLPELRGLRALVVDGQESSRTQLEDYLSTWAVRVALLVGEGVVLAVIGHPVDNRTLQRHRTEDREQTRDGWAGGESRPLCQSRWSGT